MVVRRRKLSTRLVEQKHPFSFFGSLPSFFAIPIPAPLSSISHSAGVLPPQTTASPLGYGNYPVSKSELGRATWTLLHTVAAQYPEHPSRQQKQDAKHLIEILTRMYPCEECRYHFRDIVKSNPPRVSSRDEFSRYVCRLHNIVNMSLGKPSFNCGILDQRWGSLDCEGSSCVVKGAAGK